jgi:3-hydroxyisobutyrate dehydrogenase-like beta-hydroxyacid dehydrogenase/hemerythrin-like domain-containing protein
MAQTIGIIGIGLIGLPIAKHLIAAGYDVIGYRRSGTAEFEQAGGRLARSPQEVAEAADIVFECLPSAEALAEVISGPQGIARVARAGQIVVNLSTSPLEVKRAQAEALAAKGAIMVEGEVSGLPSMVQAKRGVVFLAGPRESVERVLPVVEAFAENRFYVGEFGCALKLKVIANHLVTVHVMAAAEAMALATKAGLDPELVIKVIGPSAASSTQFNARAPMMAARQFEPVQGPFATLAHYFPLVEDLANSAGALVPLFQAASKYFRYGLEHEGRGTQDVARVFEVIEALDVIKAEHRSLAAVLDATKFLVDELRGGRIEPDFKLLWAILHYIDAFSEKLHHPKEDLYLFAKLRARTHAADALIDELQTQHQGGERRMQALQTAIGSFEADAPNAFEAFAKSVQEFADFSWKHMTLEEKQLMPLAQAHLTRSDWAEIARVFHDNNDPLFGKDQSEQFDRLFTRIANLLPAPIGLGAPSPPAAATR